MWITRDKDGDLVLHEAKPTKILGRNKHLQEDYWISVGKKEVLIFGDIWFPEVKWEDEEPRELILK